MIDPKIKLEVIQSETRSESEKKWKKYFRVCSYMTSCCFGNFWSNGVISYQTFPCISDIPKKHQNSQETPKINTQIINSTSNASYIHLQTS